MRFKPLPQARFFEPPPTPLTFLRAIGYNMARWGVAILAYAGGSSQTMNRILYERGFARGTRHTKRRRKWRCEQA